MADGRLEAILLNLIRRYAPSAKFPSGDLSTLADLLTAHHVLVIVGEPLTDDAPQQATQWANGYMGLYHLLAGALFPGLNQAHPVQASYADDQWPAVVVIVGEVVSVIGALAGLVAPFVVMRQGDTRISEAELTGLMEYVLDDLEASDLPRDDYRRLRDEGAAMLHQLLTVPIRQLPLTRAQRALFEDTTPVKPVLPGEEKTEPHTEVEPPLPVKPPPAPPDLPEMPAPPKEPPASQPPGVPPPFSAGPKERPKGTTGRLPPLPDLPDKPKKG